MNKKEEFEKLVQEFIDSKNELEMFLENLVNDIKIDNLNRTIDITSFKAVIIGTALGGINMGIFEGYCKALTEDLDDE